MTDNSYIALLGRQPEISIAELESVFGAEKIKRLNTQAALINSSDARKTFNRLGGTVMLAKLILKTEEINKLNQLNADELLEDNSHRKVTIGFSDYSGENLGRKALAIINETLKKANKKLRQVNQNEDKLNSAQVFNNKLDMDRNLGIFIVKTDENKLFIGRMARVQNLQSYETRDRTRPKRDSKVGMLPPKLAQIIINLAVEQLTEVCVLDPFCGTGVILQESLLMRFNTFGTDISSRMIDYSKENLEWLQDKYRVGKWGVETGDATSHQWATKFTTLASETYLGEPLTSQPAPGELKKLIKENKELLTKFLSNLLDQTDPGFRFCIAVPAWKQGNSFTSALSVDDLKSLGYTPVEFEHIHGELIYARPDQFVGRKLLVLRKDK